MLRILAVQLHSGVGCRGTPRYVGHAVVGAFESEQNGEVSRRPSGMPVILRLCARLFMILILIMALSVGTARVSKGATVPLASGAIEHRTVHRSVGALEHNGLRGRA